MQVAALTSEVPSYTMVPKGKKKMEGKFEFK